jgi:LacI family transcriptional regulator
MSSDRLSRPAPPVRPPTGVSRPVGVKDVARAAGVSAGTVSNVLNHPERVREDKRRRVETAVRDLGYVRNESARHLRSGSSRTLGLLLLDAWNPFFTDLAHGVEDWAADRSWALLISNSAREPERESLYLDLFAERRVQGVIAVPTGDLADRLLALRQKGIATVVVDERDTGTGSMSVSLDDVRGGELAATHLLERGHREIAFAGSPGRVTQVRDRLLGATSAVEAAGTGARLRVLPTASLSVDGGRRLGEELVRLPAAERPTALFASSDLVAIGVLQVLLRHGVRVPQDLALVGYDDIEFARQVAIPLTTVRQPSYEMGRTAAEMLIRQLTGDQPDERHVVFQPELVVRESTSGVGGR